MKSLGLATVACALALAGCQHTKERAPVVVYKTVMQEIPPELMKCVRVKYPKADQLTDKEVARLIVRLETALRQCARNMKGIDEFQKKMREKLEASS